MLFKKKSASSRRVGYEKMLPSMDSRYIAACSGLARRLKKAQKKAYKSDWRGGSAGIKCSKCSRHWDTQCQFSLDQWYWTGDLAHNIRKHNAVVSPEFIRFLFGFGGKLSSAERKLEKRL